MYKEFKNHSRVTTGNNQGTKLYIKSEGIRHATEDLFVGYQIIPMSLKVRQFINTDIFHHAEHFLPLNNLAIFNGL